MTNNSCRLCFENPGVVSIYNSNEKQINTKISYCCVNISIREDDGLPSHICNFCESQLNTSYEFLIKCEETDKKLRLIRLNNSNIEYDIRIDVKTERVHNSDDGNENSFESPIEIKQEIDLNDVSKEKHQSCENRKSKKHQSYKNRKSKKHQSYKNRKSKKHQSYQNRESKISKLTKCTICGRKCANPSTLAIHMRSHTNERPYSCESCDKTYKDGGSLKRHAQRNHLTDKRERSFICEHCGKAFFSKNEVKIHMRIHTGETPYACSTCPAKFTQLSTLQRHEVRHTGEKAHICLTCHKKFRTKDELKTHFAAHSTVKKFKCSICNALFKYKNNLRKHMRTHSEGDKFICNHCGRNFSMKGNLKMHIERLHSSKSGYCNVCSKEVSNIEVHMRKHTGERPLKCEYCANSYAKKNTLARHINFRHKKTDRYKCTVDGCSAKFPSRLMLDYHVVKLHGTVKPFQCDICSRRFYRTGDLARHKKGTHINRNL